METIAYKGYEIQIAHDEVSGSPREWDNLGTMICFHRRYNLGDLHDWKDKYDFLEFLKETYENEGVYHLPLYLYDHSGLIMQCSPFSCRWDSGRVGYIYVTKEKLKAEGLEHKPKEKIYEYLKDEVAVYNDFLMGNVYQYHIPDIGESCGGFFGYDHAKSGLLDDAKGAIESWIYTVQDDLIEK